jgi:hypothetical protein
VLAQGEGGTGAPVFAHGEGGTGAPVLATVELAFTVKFRTVIAVTKTNNTNAMTFTHLVMKIS